MVHSAKNVTEEDHAKRREDERGRTTEVPETGSSAVRQGQAGRAEQVADGDGRGDRVAPQESAAADAPAESGASTQRAEVQAKAVWGGSSGRGASGLGEPGLCVQSG